MTDTVRNPKVCVAEITAAHGVRGQVKVRSFTKNAADFASYGALTDAAGSKSFTVKVLGISGDRFLVAVDGVADRNAADALRGQKLFVDRKVLPETDDNEFYYADLVGLTAKAVDGKVLGVVKGIYNFGAGDMIEIGNMADFLPFTKEIFPETDIKNGVITVRLPDFVEVKPEAQKSDE